MNSTPQSSSGEREAIELRRQTETARVVVVDDNQLRASTLAAALKGASDTIVVVTGPDSRAMHHDLFPADLVLLALGGRAGLGAGDGRGGRAAQSLSPR